jgi:hypothetical protein
MAMVWSAIILELGFGTKLIRKLESRLKSQQRTGTALFIARVHFDQIIENFG